MVDNDQYFYSSGEEIIDQNSQSSHSTTPTNNQINAPSMRSKQVGALIGED